MRPGPARSDEAGELTAAALPRRGRGGQREAAETDTLPLLSLSLSLSCSPCSHSTHTAQRHAHARSHAARGVWGEEKRHRKLTSPSAACYLKSPRLASGCLLSFLSLSPHKSPPGARCAGAASGGGGRDGFRPVRRWSGGSACEIRWRRLHRRPAAAVSVRACVCVCRSLLVAGAWGPTPSLPHLREAWLGLFLTRLACFVWLGPCRWCGSGMRRRRREGPAVRRAVEGLRGAAV